MALIEREMPVNKVAELMRVYPNRLCTVFNYWINTAYGMDKQDGGGVLGIDETNSKKGHDYVTLAADMDEWRGLHVTEGKESETITRIREHLERRGRSGWSGKQDMHRHVSIIYRWHPARIP